ncbi:sodium/potassium-transporting ATPase subunit alpha-like [Diachasmimorpha longicaudata]|uniref:sodium/potassium-transporting ATPase subunit alpha-like n=1 Tax=Diachasmimorpha longicaudata TaxID=58733 RepID=UPI0030B8DB7A
MFGRSNQPEAGVTDKNSLREDIDTDVHTRGISELLEGLGTDVRRGLSSSRARELSAEFGANALTPPKKTSELWKLTKCCCGGFSTLIWAGAFLCFGSYILESATQEDPSQDHLWLGVVLVLLTMLTGMFSYYQESKSTKIMETFNELLPQRAVALRDGERRELNATELVPGDIVLIETGDRVPADIRILECQGLKVDNASITGESIPLLRSSMTSGGSILESKNMIFFSTNVIEGTGKGVVVACGDQTVMGRVAKLTSRLSPRPTPLAREINLFMRYISCWAVFLGCSFFIMSLAMGYGWIESLVFLIGIIVANVPEGLLATVTVSLTVTAKRMASKNCLVKNLQAIETLGCTAVICSDKTGTLTQNKMTVRHLWFDGKLREVMAGHNWRWYYNNPGFNNLARIASLCNRAEWAPISGPPPPLNKRKILGDASEAALLKCLEVLVKGGAAFFRRQYTKIFEIPFNSTDKYQANIHSSNGRYLLSLKGAPERVIEHCSMVSFGSETRELTDDVKLAYLAACDDLAKNGERILGFADLELPDELFPRDFQFTGDPPNFPLQNLRLVGLMAMIDPPRPTVPDAVYKCRLAGVKVIMVTGDHPDTARAIAKAVGIITEDPQVDSAHSIVITGSELREFGDGELDGVIRTHPEIVFARTSPVQKLQIVESCQRLHLITAVTGDGVNDSPALKKADIGVSMGITGSDVSRQVADLILLDDNFASIITGIEEGRRIFDSLKSAIAYTLASNVPEITPFLAFIAFGIPLPVGIICVLCIDLGTDMWPAIALAYEESESDLIKRPPRIPQTDHLVSRKLVFMSYGQIGIIEMAAGFFTYFVVMAEHGFWPGDLVGLRAAWDNPAVNDLKDSYGQEWSYQQRKVLEYTCHTAFFVAIVIVQVADAIICKTRRNSILRQGMTNWVLNLGILFEILMACAVSYAPHMDVVLKTYPLKAHWWLPGVPYAILIIVYDELRKLWIRRHPGGWWDRETSY